MKSSSSTSAAVSAAVSFALCNSRRTMMIFGATRALRLQHNQGGAGGEEGFGSGSAPSSASSQQKHQFSQSAEHAYNTANSLSGIPTNRGTMAALATMRLRRVAAQEELDNDRREMMAEGVVGRNNQGGKRRDLLNNDDGASAPPSSSSSSGASAAPPTDGEVKAWREAKQKEEAAALFRRQRMARDSFVREILGSAPPPRANNNNNNNQQSASSSAVGIAGARNTSNSNNSSSSSSSSSPRADPLHKGPNNTTRYVLHDADGKIAEKDTRRGGWQPNDPLAGKAFSEASHVDASGEATVDYTQKVSSPTAANGSSTSTSTSTSSGAQQTETEMPKAHLNSQADYDYRNYPGEETAERLQQAAAKYKHDGFTAYGVAEMTFKHRQLMIRIALGAIVFILIPIMVDPDGTMMGGGFFGDYGDKRRAQIRKQQAETLKANLAEKQRAADGAPAAAESSPSSAVVADDDDEDDSFYAGKKASTAGASGGPSTLVQEFNPIVTVFGSIVWYGKLLFNASAAANAMAYGGEHARKVHDRTEHNKELIDKAAAGIEGKTRYS